MTKEMKQEFTLRISQANKSGMVVILYEMLLAYLEDAQVSLNEAGDYRSDLTKARKCLHELRNSLHFEYALAYQLLQLYIYVDKLISRADISGKQETITEALSIIRRLHDAYEQISHQDTSEPVMGNTQQVYAGLTYGKKSLCENRNDGNRGFLV